MQRDKRTFRNRLYGQKLSNQKMETMIAYGVLNRFTSIGMTQIAKGSRHLVNNALLSTKIVPQTCAEKI